MDYEKRFFLWIKTRGLQPNTIETYISCLRVFLNYCTENGVLPEDVSDDCLLEYVSNIKSESTRIQAKGMLFNLYASIGIPYKTAHLPHIKRHRSLPSYLTVSQVHSLFNCVKNTKQKLILKIQYSLALRVHEVVKLKGSDFIKKYNHHTGTYVYDIKIKGKGGNEDIVPVHDETIIEIVSVFGSDILGKNEYLFKGQFKEHYSEKSVQMIMNRALNQLDIKIHGKCTHLLRHSQATHLIQQGINQRHVQLILRHKSIKTTQLYTHANTDDLRIVYKKAHENIAIEINQNKQIGNY